MPFTDTLKFVQVVSDDSGLLSAVPEDVLDGVVFIGKSKTFKVGTLPRLDSHEEDVLLGAGDSYIVDYGFNPIKYNVNVKTLSEQTVGDALAEHILIDKIAWVNGSEVVGTMPDNGSDSHTLMAGESYTVPLGYHDGTGVINCPSLAAQTAGTASKEHILLGKTAWVNGEEVTGIMPDNGSVSQTLYCNDVFTIPLGYHDGTGSIVAASLAAQTAGTAHDYEMVQGVIAWVNGEMVTGTVPVIPQFSHRLHIDASGYSSYTIPAGFHEADSLVYLAVPTMNGTTIAPGADDISINTNGNYLYGNINILGVDAYEYWQHDSEHPTEIFLPEDTSITGTTKKEIYRCEVHNWRDNATSNAYGIRLTYNNNIYDGCLFINNLGDTTFAGNTRATRMNIGSNSLYLSIELDPDTKAHVFYLNSESLSSTASITDIKIEALLDLRVFGEERTTPDPVLPDDERYVPYNVLEDDFIQKAYFDIINSGHYTIVNNDSNHIIPTSSLTIIDQDEKFVNIVDLYYIKEPTTSEYEITQYITFAYTDNPGIQYKKYYTCTKNAGVRTTKSVYTEINTTWYEPIEKEYSSESEFPVQSLTISYPDDIERDPVKLNYPLLSSTNDIDEIVNNITAIYNNIIMSKYYYRINLYQYDIDPTDDLIVEDQDNASIKIDEIYAELEHIDGKENLFYKIVMCYEDNPTTKYSMSITYYPDADPDDPDSVVGYINYYKIINGSSSTITKSNFPIQYIYITYPTEISPCTYNRHIYTLSENVGEDTITLKFIDDIKKYVQYTSTTDGTTDKYTISDSNVKIYNQNDDELILDYVSSSSNIYIIRFKDFESDIIYERKKEYNTSTDTNTYTYSKIENGTTTVYSNASEFPISEFRMEYPYYFDNITYNKQYTVTNPESLCSFYDDIIENRRYRKYNANSTSDNRIIPNDSIIVKDSGGNEYTIKRIGYVVNGENKYGIISMYDKSDEKTTYNVDVGPYSSTVSYYSEHVSDDGSTITPTTYNDTTFPIQQISVKFLF